MKTTTRRPLPESKLILGLAALLPAALGAALLWYYDVFVNWQPALYPFALAALATGVLALTILMLCARGERKISAYIWKSLLSLGVFIGLLTGVSFLINNVLGGGGKAWEAAVVALPLCAAQILTLCALLLRALKRGRVFAGIWLAAVTLITGALGFAVESRRGLICGTDTPPFALTAPEPPDGDYAQWEVYTREYLTGDLSWIVSEDSGTLAWGSSYDLNAYCRAYQATGEEIYLEKAGGYLYGIFRLAADNDGDGYKNWGTGTYSDGAYREWLVHTGALLSCAGEWANLVISTPGILEKLEPTSGMTYRALCGYLIGEATGQLIPAFDREWDDGIGIYAELPDWTSPPNNQFLAMAAALMQFAKLSPAHEEEYLRRAQSMLDAFHSKLCYDSGGNITRWNYKDSYFPTDRFRGGPEDFSHSRWSFRAAIMGYANGLAFTENDIRAFARIYNSMVRGTDDEPLLTYCVDGRGSLEAPGLFHYDLSPFGDYMWRIGYKTAEFRGAPAYAGDAARILAYHEAAPAPLAFGLFTPETGPKRTLLRWEPSIHACKYTLQISDREDFSHLLIDRANILDTSAFVEGLPAGETLYWRVISANQGGGHYTSDEGEITV